MRYPSTVANPPAAWNDSARQDEILRDIPRRLSPLNPKLIILFGSRAGHWPKPDSDYDLLVVLDLPNPRAPRGVAVRRLLRGLDVPFDIVVYTPQEWDEYRRHPQAFAYEIARSGKVLYDAS